MRLMGEPQGSIVVSVRFSGKEYEAWENFCKFNLGNADPKKTAKQILLEMMRPTFTRDYFNAHCLQIQKGECVGFDKRMKVSLTESEFEAEKMQRLNQTFQILHGLPVRLGPHYVPKASRFRENFRF